jgi:hypothetical protein
MNTQKPEQMSGTHSPSQPSAGSHIADTLILDFQPPDCQKTNSCSLSMLLCYGSLGRLKQSVIKGDGYFETKNCQLSEHSALEFCS